MMGLQRYPCRSVSNPSRAAVLVLSGMQASRPMQQPWSEALLHPGVAALVLSLMLVWT